MSTGLWPFGIRRFNPFGLGLRSIQQQALAPTVGFPYGPLNKFPHFCLKVGPSQPAKATSYSLIHLLLTKI